MIDRMFDPVRLAVLLKNVHRGCGVQLRPSWNLREQRITRSAVPCVRDREGSIQAGGEPVDMSHLVDQLEGQRQRQRHQRQAQRKLSNRSDGGHGHDAHREDLFQGNCSCFGNCGHSHAVRRVNHSEALWRKHLWMAR